MLDLTRWTDSLVDADVGAIIDVCQMLMVWCAWFGIWLLGPPQWCAWFGIGLLGPPWGFITWACLG